MKKLFILTSLIILTACAEGKKVKVELNQPIISNQIITENFDWLIGNWKRLYEEEGKETFENWEKINKNIYKGHGFTLQNSDTLWQEYIQLTKEDTSWNLLVKSPEETEFTTFAGVTHNPTSFTFENLEIEFPNKIHYWIEGENLKASVSGAEMKIDFTFEKIQQIP